MKVLVIGGTGMIGGHAVQKLAQDGHDVVVGARKPAPEGTPMARFPALYGDYSQGEFSESELEGFDAVVFAAGNDIRHLPRGTDRDEFWRVMQIEGVPNFVARAKRAGVGRVVQLGSYYHQVMPHLAETDDYVRARKLADEGARALADASFNVSTLNPPSIVGAIQGISAKRYESLAAWARGERPDIPVFAPAGGTNYMSVKSLCEAISGALGNAESGKAYLVGDQNLRFCDFFQLFFDAVGSSQRVEERDEEHPFLPDAFIVPGRGNVLSYEPDPAETDSLGYSRNDVERAVREVVDMVSADEAGR
ncbi:NAD(P)-dependent oxidoreductase [Oricola sp.]|uniref:NAD-dependent epimerase/dehydratase family protein n=1 Tax=Oricola sp. TaxID=1979950 RepID=UPI0025F85F1F|nr:NAD(P)-dependent oxidoreductase [Oricola sp.]MCI5074485.1 NAD(P)-dependent oxidoreductase [Oricola sp.]